MGTKILNNQKRAYFSYVWKGLAITAIAVFAAVMVSRKGAGRAPSRRGLAMTLYRLVEKLAGEGPGAETRMVTIVIFLFGIIGMIGLFNVIKGIRNMESKHTVLGKSILHQIRERETFEEALHSIDADMQHGAATFGRMSVGREWILETEAMRLANIQGVFWMDEGEEDYVLCCVDGRKEIWASSFRYRDEREQAMEYLKKRYPEFISGDKAVYIDFIRGETVLEERK